jgi:hypoxanthine phosphoribosyltransferase
MWAMANNATPRLKVLLTASQIERRINRMAQRITRDYRGQPVHLIGVLGGAVIFLADLVRRIPLEVSIDFLAASSYGNRRESSGRPRLTKDLDADIAGRNVILVDDILDTGYTLSRLMRLMRKRKPRSLRVAVLLDKPDRREVPLEADYVGFRIPDRFVVGFGMDYAGRYRNLPDVRVLEDVAAPASRQRNSRARAARHSARGPG